MVTRRALDSSAGGSNPSLADKLGVNMTTNYKGYDVILNISGGGKNG